MKPQPSTRHTSIKTFGEALRMVRTERGLSHKEIADRVGLKKDAIRQWEANETVPSNFHLKKLYGTFSSLRYFTTLLSNFDRERLTAQAVDYVDKARKGEVVEYPWLPPIAGVNEEMPEELLNIKRPRTFGEHLRALRLAEGIDLEELGKILEVTNQAVSAWELDKVNPVMDHYVKLRTLFPGLKSAPEPDAADMPKPNGGKGITRNLGSANGNYREPPQAPRPPARSVPTLRAVPTAFDAIQDLVRMPLAEPNPEPPAPPEPEKVEEEPEPAPPAPVLSPLEQAGADYARYVAAQQDEEFRVAMLKAELALAEKNLAEVTELAKLAHAKIIEIATKR